MAESMQNCDREGVRKHFYFGMQKGPDMLLLESGCQVPVMDVWMIRRIQPVSPEPNMGFETWVRRRVQNTKRYERYRQAVIDEANACGIPTGEFHVACWLEQLLGPDSREVAELYVDELLDAINEPPARA
jgi:hypothetical protein